MAATASAASRVKPNRLVIQLDGVSYSVLREACRKNFMPFCQKLIEGNWQFHKVYSGIPSTTPAGQFSLLFGKNDVVVGFRFLVKKKSLLFKPTITESVRVVQSLGETVSSKSYTKKNDHNRNYIFWLRCRLSVGGKDKREYE